MALAPSQSQALALAERISSGFSLASLSFIISSFIAFPPLRKPIHTLMFFAAWGDAVYNIATLIATSGIDAGTDSALCQFQGFTIEMFLWTDTLWNLAMAVDVYLTVFHKYDNSQLKQLEKWYLISIYGFSFVLAFALCFAGNPERGKVYGPAILWCWISLDWDFMRMVMLYGPVWVVILAIGIIYILSGFEIYRKDRAIRNFPSTSSSQPDSTERYKMNEVHVCTDTTVVSADRDLPVDENGPWPEGKVQVSSAPSGTAAASKSERPETVKYSVTVETRKMDRSAQRHKRRSAINHKRRAEARAGREATSSAWTYTKCAMMFFVALLITWLPSTINRVYSLVFPEVQSWPLNLAAAIVLPLMGFWNTVIYVVTSWSTFRRLWRDWRASTTATRRIPSPAAVEAGSSQEDLTERGMS